MRGAKLQHIKLTVDVVRKREREKGRNGREKLRIMCVGFPLWLEQSDYIFFSCICFLSVFCMLFRGDGDCKCVCLTSG